MLQGMSHIMQGKSKKSSSAELVTIRLQLGKTNATAQIDRSGVVMEFPQFVAGFASTGSAAGAHAEVAPLFGVSGSDRSESGLSQSLIRVDASGQQQRFDFATGVVVEEPLLVGHHLIATWLDYRKGQSGISLFLQDQLAAGPVAQARMDRLLPLGFHGCFIG
jgi:carotenoid cleavage dioxygenase-like enzyme